MFQGKGRAPPDAPVGHEDDEYSTLAQYCIDFTFTLVIITFLWNLFLICRIQFSRIIIVTRLTFQPYLFALAFLSVQFVECLALMISQVSSGEIPQKVIEQQFVSRYTIGLLGVKFVLFYVFILTQTLEYWLLSLFVTIQNSVTLAELDIVKQLYMEQEAKLYKLNKARIYVVAFLQTGIGILPFFAGIDLRYIVIA